MEKDQLDSLGAFESLLRFWVKLMINLYCNCFFQKSGILFFFGEGSGEKGT